MTLSESTEQAFLGCLIRAPEIFETISLVVTKEYFASLKSQRLYEIIKAWVEFYEEPEKLSDAEFITFTESQYGEWYKRSAAFVGECFKFIPDKFVALEKWEIHFASLEKFLYYRKFKELIHTVDKTIDTDPLNINNHIHNTMNELTTTFAGMKDFQKQSTLIDAVEGFQEIFQTRMDPNFSPSKFNLEDVDNLVGGYYPSSYNLITARSSVGKSAFVNTITQNMVYKQNKKIAVLNIETGNFPFLMRWFSKDLSIDSKLIRDPKLMSAQQRKDIMEASAKLAKNYGNQLFLIQDVYYVEQIIQTILYLHKQYGLDGVFIDLLEYVRAREKTESRQKEIAFISNEFFNLTRRNSFWVTMIQQQNKEGDKKGEQSSGRNAEDPFMQADTVIGLYHAETESGEKDPHHRICKVTKGRDSGTGSVMLKFNGKYTLFEDAHDQGTLE